MEPNVLLDQEFYSTHAELFAELLRSVKRHGIEFEEQFLFEGEHTG